MSYEEALKTISVEASDDLSADQYKIVDVDTSGQLVVVSSAGAKMIGVLQDKPAAAGRVGSVGIDGVTKVVTGATFDAGVRVYSDDAGLATGVGGAGTFSLGVAMEGAGTIGDIVAVKIDITEATA